MQHITFRVRAAALLGLLAVATSMPVRAEDQGPIQTSFVINDDDPVSSVPTPEQAAEKPLEMGYFLMLLDERAQAATAKQRHSQAAQYYRAMAKAVPNRSVGFSKACRSHALAKEWDQAIEVCKVALGTDGVKVADLVLYVHVMLDSRKPLSATDVEDVDAVIERLRTHVSQSDLADLECQLAVRLEDVVRLRACNVQLATINPNAPQALVYASMLAIKVGDWLQAERIIERARKAGLPAAGIAAMEANLATHRPKVVASERLPIAWMIVAAVALGLIAAFLVRSRMRRVIAQS